MGEKANFWGFIRAFWIDFRKTWFAAMSGAFSVPFAFLAANADNKYQAFIFGLMAFLGVWYAAYAVWKIQKERADRLEAKIAPVIKLVEIVERRNRDGEATSQDFTLLVQNSGEVALASCLVKVDEFPNRYKNRHIPMALKTLMQHEQQRAGAFNLRAKETKEVRLCTATVHPGDDFINAAIHYEVAPQTFDPEVQSDIRLGLYCETSPSFVRLRFARGSDGFLKVTKV